MAVVYELPFEGGTMANQKQAGAVDELLDGLLQGKKPEEILGREGLLGELTKRLVERALEAEMAAHLGYDKHAPEGRNGANSRNGRTRKRVQTGTAKLEIEVPRDRNGSFRPQLVPKRRRRLAGFDDKVLALYARGLTTREIQGHLRDLYGVEVSPSLISVVTDAVLEDVQAWQARPLERCYPVVYLDALHLKMRKSRHVETCAVYVALALTLEGHKEVLGLWVGEAEGAKFWLGVLSELKNRGLEDVLIMAVDGLKGFPEAIEAVYPRTQVQLCLVHMVRNSLRYVSWKHRKGVARDLRKIYTAPTREAGERALDAFAEAWDPLTPLISRQWRTQWANVSTLFDYPPEIRRAIYTTNAIESIQAQLRKVTRKRGAFPTEDAVRKVLFLALQKAAERWTMPIPDWPAALYHLSLVFPGRVPLG
jgi:putative transposase